VSELGLHIESVPAGRWAVGVSGGADSVALLLLLRSRADLSLHVVHLDHQTREGASGLDAEFVAALAERLGLPAAVARRDSVERGMEGLPMNISSRYRAVRLELFRRVVDEHGLDGVVLAHHSDDQAETVLLRLMRGSGVTKLGGMEAVQKVGGLLIRRPLLGVRRGALREYLASRGEAWREDVSNASDAYARNRVRKWLERFPEGHELLIKLGASCRRYGGWIRAGAPELGDSFRARELAGLPRVLAREAGRRWLIEQGALPGELTAAVLDRFAAMAVDAATPGRQQFPGNVDLRRRGGKLSAARRPERRQEG
jgi:tRNA(Ile)-lysidine synthetase-like protein